MQIMQRTLLPIVAGCVAAFVFAAPKPASATTAATTAIHYGETNAGVVEKVHRRHWRGRRAPYAYGYGYRPYGYRPYAYYGGPYGYYGRPYGYWGRPGISLGFSF